MEMPVMTCFFMSFQHLLFRNEVRGVQPSTCDASDVVLEIPQLGVKQSMNVSVCAGIVLWYASQNL